MADKIPLKVNAGQVQQFSTGDTVPVASGGTGLDAHLAANGALLIGNGAGFTLTVLSAGPGVTVVNGAGSITVRVTEPVYAGVFLN